MVWASSLAGSRADAIADALASRYRLARETARAHVDEALSLDPNAGEVGPLSGPYLYQRTADGFALSRDGTALLLIDARGQSVSLAAPGAVAPRDLPLVLQAVAPKLLSLRGHFVLHASAVAIGQGLVAFSGKSGSGKTTTARALARAGATLVCEDKLVVKQDDGKLVGLLEGERAIMTWVAEAAPKLADASPAACDGWTAPRAARRGRSTPSGFWTWRVQVRRSPASL